MVFDVMIHDLDIVLAIDHSDVVSVDAVGVPVLSHKVDIANARLKFASGCTVNLTASRISRDRVRKVALLPARSLCVGRLWRAGTRGVSHRAKPEIGRRLRAAWCLS